MSGFSTFINSNTGGSAISSLLGLGAGLILSNQDKQKAKGEANIQRDLANTQLQIAQLNQQTELARIEALKNQTKTSGIDNTNLYIGLGIGGVVILGLVVFLAVKK